MISALIALALTGCANSTWQISAGGAPALSPPAGASASWAGSTGLGAVFTFGLLNYAMSGGTPFYAAPPMDPQRRVLEHDCTRPIEDTAANLRCR